MSHPSCINFSQWTPGFPYQHVLISGCPDKHPALSKTPQRFFLIFFFFNGSQNNHLQKSMGTATAKKIFQKCTKKAKFILLSK